MQSQQCLRARLVLAGMAGVFLLACVAPAGSQTGLSAEHAASNQAAPSLSAEQIAQRMQQRFLLRTEALQSYESRRVMTLAYKGTLADKVASETVQMTFTAPGSKQFVILSAMGSPLLRDSVFQRAMDSEQQAAARGENAIVPANYEMQLVGTERLPEGACYILSVVPRHPGRFSFHGRIWVHATEFVVVRIEAQPVESPSFWVKNGAFHTEFSKVGDFWFPARTVSSSHVRLGGEAVLTIEYGSYHILNAHPLPAPAPVAAVSGAAWGAERAPDR